MRASTLLAVAALALGLPAAGARAQMAGMGAPASEAAPYGAPVDDQHIWTHLLIDQLEGRLGDGGAALRWDAEGWTGTDAWRFVLKSEGDRMPNGKVEDGQQEVFFDKPLTSFWNVQVGGRYDLDSGPGRGWGAIGIEGLAPRFVNVTATAYAGEKGLAGKVKLSYDQLITNRLILQPEGELNLYSENDPARMVGAGFSDLDAGLRLRYEITRKFAPYVGVALEQKFGRTADFFRAAGERTSDVRFAVGVRSWF
jgi:copper resistance protein B